MVSVATRSFAFAKGEETKGNARKTTGSYYTPDGLVQLLLDSTLEPVVQETLARQPAKPVDALLNLAIVDPACGSGHFLLAAARRLAAHVARLQTNGTPSAAEYRHALRQVVGAGEHHPHRPRAARVRRGLFGHRTRHADRDHAGLRRGRGS